MAAVGLPVTVTGAGVACEMVMGLSFRWCRFR